MPVVSVRFTHSRRLQIREERPFAFKGMHSETWGNPQLSSNYDCDNIVTCKREILVSTSRNSREGQMRQCIRGRQENHSKA